MASKSTHYSVRNRPSALWIRLCLALLLCAQCVSGQNSRPAARPDDILRDRTVYVIQSYFHTGFIIELDREARSRLEFAPRFGRFRYVDIGWGEEVFYQDPEFTLSKGARAIFLPSKSVLRVEGFNQDMGGVIAWSDRAMKISMTRNEFARLCSFINGSLKKDRDNGLDEASEHDNGEIIFFKSPHTYYLFNTCNTWIARALRHAGFDISPTGVVTARTLFWKLNKVGVSLKAPK
jgi:hypothetical protein